MGPARRAGRPPPARQPRARIAGVGGHGHVLVEVLHQRGELADDGGPRDGGARDRDHPPPQANGGRPDGVGLGLEFGARRSRRERGIDGVDPCPLHLLGDQQDHRPGRRPEGDRQGLLRSGRHLARISDANAATRDRGATRRERADRRCSPPRASDGAADSMSAPASALPVRAAVPAAAMKPSGTTLTSRPPPLGRLRATGDAVGLTPTWGGIPSLRRSAVRASGHAPPPTGDMGRDGTPTVTPHAATAAHEPRAGAGRCPRA
jgi:hypothetical protein